MFTECQVSVLKLEPTGIEAQICQSTFLPLDTQTVVKIVDDQASRARTPVGGARPLQGKSLDIKVLTGVMEAVLGSLRKQIVEAR